MTSISDTYRRSIGVWSYDFQATSPDALPLSYKRQVGGKAITEQGSSDK